MLKNKKKLLRKVIAAMSIMAFSAGMVNLSEAAIERIPSISSRTHGTMQDRNNDRFNRNRNNRQNDNQVTAPKDENNENVNNNDVQPQETPVETKNENNNSRAGSRRNDISSRRRETPAKIVRDIDSSHDATYDEDDRYKAQRESYFEDDGNGRIVDEQKEVVEERRQVSATESDRDRGRETIINRYEGENDRRGSRGNRNSRDNGGITVVVNNNIPIENNVNVDVEAVNKNDNKNDVKSENNTELISTNNNKNDNKNINESKVEQTIIEKIDPPKDETPKIPTDAYEYNGHSYYIYSSKANTWEEAREFCASLNGYLMIINDIKENDAIYNYMRKVGYDFGAYFGLKKNDDGEWYWVDGQKLEFSEWAPNQPNTEDANNKYGKYYPLVFDWACAYRWCASPFGTITNAFVCEWDCVIP